MKPRVTAPGINRRQILRSLALAAGCSMLSPGLAFARQIPLMAADDEAFLDELERQGALYFWEQASPRTGQVLDRARHDLGGERDSRRMASIAATGFGLTTLCIPDKRGSALHAQVLERVRKTL